jgi:hypothetical protein
MELERPIVPRMVLAKPNRFRLRKQLVALKKISIVEGVQQANSPKDEMN